MNDITYDGVDHGEEHRLYMKYLRAVTTLAELLATPGALGDLQMDRSGAIGAIDNAMTALAVLRAYVQAPRIGN